MTNRILPLIFASLLITTFSFAQKCGSYEGSLAEQIQKYPEFYKNIESKNIELEIQHQKDLRKLNFVKNENDVKIIPVVVHVIHDMGNENISDASIQGALDVLNANINGQASNFLNKTPDVFAAVRGDAKIEFRLAKIDPLGNPTTGINRVRSTLTSQPEPRDAVKSLSYWSSYKYFNIWTVKQFAPQDDGNTLLGYAQFPWSGSMSTDGVVLLASQMVSGGTLTHEVGHWLGLRHTWGDATCGDDGVKDTPPARDPNFGVNLSQFPYHVGIAPPPGITGAWGCIADSLNWAGEMFVNYMDYSNDADVTMFTKDQNKIMNVTLEGELDEETGLTGIGYREYMWSPENIANTGTGDGYLPPFCSQEASFVVMNGASSICEGEALLLKGNKTMFGTGNITSFVWSFGDGSEDDSGDNFLSHTYNSVNEDGYEVKLTVDYNETIQVRSSDPDLLPGGDAVYSTELVNHMVQGTMDELISMGANDITEIPIDSLGVYFGMEDSSFYRGYIEKGIYIATYNNSCTSEFKRTNFVKVFNNTASSNASSYNYSFESASDLDGDWVLSQTTNMESMWSFDASNNTEWKWISGAASDGSSCIKVDAEDMLTGVSTEIISKAYNLSSFTSPAIKFSWAGAAINTFPENELVVTYSDDCGETWKSLGTLDPIQSSNAGLYTTSFKPKSSEWNDIVMTKSQLKNSNIRFKFEYIVNGRSNNFYLDNIMIGEEANLIQYNNITNSKLSIFPNPAKGNVTISLDNIADNEVDIILINILGAQVSQIFSGKIVGNYQEFPFDIATLEKGIYFVKVVSNGDIIMTDKLIVD